jgi:hypothetical protein
LAGRVPAGAEALVMQALPGAELTCRARNYVFGWGRGMQERGVISYYAARAMPEAHTFEDWLAGMVGLIEADAHSGRLPKTYRSALQVLGDAATSVIGTPTTE